MQRIVTNQGDERMKLLLPVFRQRLSGIEAFYLGRRARSISLKISHESQVAMPHRVKG